MNVYDFDGTIYEGDSSKDFCLYLYRHYPSTWRCLPRQLAALVGYMSGRLDKTAFKERFFSMFAAVPDMDVALNDFVDTHADHILRYYPHQARYDDVIVSASPTFLVEALCARLGLSEVVASEVDKYTGRFASPNCYGQEKVTRFLAAGYDPAEVENVYSDSLSDTPLAELGREAYIVQPDGSLDTWQMPKQRGLQGFFTLFNKPEALVTLVVGAAHLLTAGHAAKVVLRDKKWPTSTTYSAILGLNTISISVCLTLLGQRSPLVDRVARAFRALSLPLSLATVGLVGAFAAAGASPVVALAAGTVAGLPLLYKGTSWLFRREIERAQRQHEGES